MYNNIKIDTTNIVTFSNFLIINIIKPIANNMNKNNISIGNSIMFMKMLDISVNNSESILNNLESILNNQKSILNNLESILNNYTNITNKIRYFYNKI
jgi:uncharacterized protein YhhL (DUF1145 family)